MVNWAQGEIHIVNDHMSCQVGVPCRATWLLCASLMVLLVLDWSVLLQDLQTGALYYKLQLLC